MTQPMTRLKGVCLRQERVKRHRRLTESATGLTLVSCVGVAPCGARVASARRSQTGAAGASAAEAGQLVTFGISPTHPETGYGYLELADAPGTGKPTPLPLKRFVEKPDAETAEQMLAAGNYLWNAGIFLFSVKTILAAFRTHAPELVGPVQQAVDAPAHHLVVFDRGRKRGLDLLHDLAHQRQVIRDLVVVRRPRWGRRRSAG